MTNPNDIGPNKDENKKQGREALINAFKAFSKIAPDQPLKPLPQKKLTWNKIDVGYETSDRSFSILKISSGSWSLYVLKPETDFSTFEGEFKTLKEAKAAAESWGS